MKTNFVCTIFIFAASLMVSCKKDCLQPGTNPSNFVKGINNPYLPWVPGYVFNYVNTITDGKEITIENIQVTVTKKTKIISGVTCEVIHDVARVNGKITEDTYDWYAQDKEGNVWYFGESTKAYEDDGSYSSEGSWEAGVNNAKPGIAMYGSPQAHIGVIYYQEYLKGVAEDQATVLSTNVKATVPYGRFINCVKTKEITALEPGTSEIKYYAPGVGQVLTVVTEGGNEREELVSITH